MENDNLTPGLILKILFDHTTEGRKYFADYYINRDRTLVYKWINGSAALSKKHVPDVVRFAVDHTVPSVQLQVRSEIQRVILASGLCEESKESLLRIEDFDIYLREALLHAISTKTTVRSPKSSVGEETPKEAPKEEKHSLAVVVYALLAATVGGFLWNLLNHLFQWSFYMGGSGNEPAGIASAIWGMLSVSPVFVFSLLSLEKDILPADKKKVGIPLILYAVGGGLGAFVFYNSGFRSYVESYGFAYGYQECLIAGVYAFLISNFPLTALFPVFWWNNISRKKLYVLLFLPLCTTVIAVLCTWLVNRPEIEVAQLRGFVAGIVLKLSMFVTVRNYMKSSFFTKIQH